MSPQVASGFGTTSP